MTDIVERLREIACEEAADEIELLRKSVVIVQHERDATIERCAQVAEAGQDLYGIRRDIAAAIRALKDKRHTICNSDAAEDDDL